MTASIITSLVVFVIVVGVYFAPSMIAADRHVTNVGSVIVINVFLGWTLIGWVVALAMALRTSTTKPAS